MSQDFLISVRVALVKHGKNQKWLAEKLGISDAYMSDILKGKRKPDKQLEPIKAVLKGLEEEEK